jgi:alpha-galactosidase
MPEIPQASAPEAGPGHGPAPSSAGISRRRLLQAGGAGAAALVAGAPLSGCAAPNALAQVESSARPPFSFTYGGKPSAELLKSWPHAESVGAVVGGRQETTTTWTDPATKLQVRWVRTTYQGFPHVAWTVYFQNGGKSNSATIADILVLDTTMDAIPGKGAWTVHTAQGSNDQAEDFQPIDLSLTAPGSIGLLNETSSLLLFATYGGRPTNSQQAANFHQYGWPYYNIDWKSGGLIAALGWQGQWSFELQRTQAGALQLRGGMSQASILNPGETITGTQLAALYLEPAEQISTPLVVLQDWSGGDWVDAQNVWRRWLLAYHLPRTQDGQPPQPVSSAQANQYYVPNFMDTAADELTFLNGYGANHATPATGGGIANWWLDAGWYEVGKALGTWEDQELWAQTGTWTPSPTRFPGGLAPIAQRAKQLGMGFILWFEPQRVMPGTRLYADHPDWLLAGPPNFPEWNGYARLLNFGLPAARDWAIQTIGDLIASQGVTLYREDFNIDPLAFWTQNDPPGRQGITQIQYVEGHLAYWAALRKRFPYLMIDSCASGGRRLDLQTLQLSFGALLDSDYAGHAVGNQVHNYGISYWLPLGGGAAAVDGSPDDLYNARSGMASCYHLSVFVLQPNTVPGSSATAVWDTLGAMSLEWQGISDAYLGDFYPLTAYSLAPDGWMAWQYHGSMAGGTFSANAGFVQAFRRSESTVSSMTFPLRGLGSTTRYLVKDLAAGTSTTQLGSDLMRTGLTVALGSAPAATTITYQAQS